MSILRRYNRYSQILSYHSFQKADIVVTALTISEIREVDIDFTTPYIDLGLTFVMKVSILVWSDSIVHCNKSHNGIVTTIVFRFPTRSGDPFGF